MEILRESMGSWVGMVKQDTLIMTIEPAGKEVDERRLYPPKCSESSGLER